MWVDVMVVKWVGVKVGSWVDSWAACSVYCWAVKKAALKARLRVAPRVEKMVGVREARWGGYLVGQMERKKAEKMAVHSEMWLV